MSILYPLKKLKPKKIQESNELQERITIIAA